MSPTEDVLGTERSGETGHGRFLPDRRYYNLRQSTCARHRLQLRLEEAACEHHLVELQQLRLGWDP